MSGYTKGPWKASRRPSKLAAESHSEFRIGNSRLFVATTCGFVDDDDKDVERQQANAHLIAAAPELLGALKAIVQRYTELMGRDCDKHDFACCVYSAEDVIAKAEGR